MPDKIENSQVARFHVNVYGRSYFLRLQLMNKLKMLKFDIFFQIWFNRHIDSI